MTDKPTTMASKGLFRTILVGDGALLTDTFSSISHSEMAHSQLSVSGKQLASAYVDVPAGDGTGSWELINIGDGIFSVITRCEFNDVRTETVVSEDFLEIHIWFTGPLHLDISDNEQFDSSSPFVFLSKPGINSKYQVRFEPGEKHLLALYIKPQIIDMLGFSRENLPLEIDKLLSTPPGSVGYTQIPISIAILNASKQIMDTTYTGSMRLIYIEAKVWELLIIIFDELSNNRSSEGDNVLEIISGSEMKLLEQARKILEGNLASTPTISELAKIVGTNTTKLKHGFKLVFGMTIFECGHHYKMKEALRLLAEEKLSVGMVANAVGYQHQASFSAAFKEYYDILPREAKKLSSESRLVNSLPKQPPI